MSLILTVVIVCISPYKSRSVLNSYLHSQGLQNIEALIAYTNFLLLVLTVKNNSAYMKMNLAITTSRYVYA